MTAEMTCVTESVVISKYYTDEEGGRKSAVHSCFCYYGLINVQRARENDIGAWETR